jgi:hypothetical protein
MEAIRCLIAVIVDMNYSNLFRELSNDSETVYRIFKWMNIISLNVMFILAVNDFINRKPKPVNTTPSPEKPKKEIKSN